jgi:hypothetical protein
MRSTLILLSLLPVHVWAVSPTEVSEFTAGETTNQFYVEKVIDGKRYWVRLVSSKCSRNPPYQCGQVTDDNDRISVQ